MAMRSKKSSTNKHLINVSRFLLVVFALLIAATHLSYIIPSGSAPSSMPSSSHTYNAVPSGQSSSTAARPPASLGFQALGLWLDIEIIAYTIIALVYLLGLRSWYLPAVLFNAFNVGIYFLSGMVAIPGITSMAFGSRLGGLSHFVTAIMIVSWIAALILGLLLLKYDPGSGLDRIYRKDWDWEKEI
jgi:hypothetical protein